MSADPYNTGAAVDEHAGKVPRQIKRITEALGTEAGQGTFVYLLENGVVQEETIMNDLCRDDADEKSVRRALSDLQDAGLVRRLPAERYSAKYVVTGFGERVTDNLFNSLRPVKTRVREAMTRIFDGTPVTPSAGSEQE